MSSLIRDAPLGRIVNWCSGGRVFPHSYFSPDDFATISESEHQKEPRIPLEGENSSGSNNLDLSAKSNIIQWRDNDDSDNPQNWPRSKKIFVTLVLNVYTFAVYIGSSIYTSSETDVMEKFNVGAVESSLGLALYVLAYGTGTLLLSPLSEIPLIGRSIPYVASFTIFTILCVPTSLVNNLAGLLVLRFLLGFFGSPALATSGASLADIWPPHQFTYVIGLWSLTASCGPSLGPLVSSFAVHAEGWHWGSWELLWLSGPILLLLFCCLPETSADNILLRRARHIRQQTGNGNIRSSSEIKQANMTVGRVVSDAILKPWEVNIFDPAVLFSTIYSGLLYGIFYSFFESLPLVYPTTYGFNDRTTALIFLSGLPTCGLTLFLYCIYIRTVLEPRMKSGDIGPPEDQLVPGILASFFVPAGLFIFAWTSRSSIPWIVPTLGIAIEIGAFFAVMQSIFSYIPFIYPTYAASLFAANSLSRSAFAFAAILFSTPMFKALKVSGGVSLLAGLAVLCIGGVTLLYCFGAKLRARSRFAIS